MAPTTKKPTPPPATQFDPATVPPLLDDEKTVGGGRTLYLDIPLGNGVAGGTAVYLPGNLDTPVNALVYFHGNKAVVPHSDGSSSTDVSGFPLKDYLRVPEYDLRVAVGRAHLTEFVLVVPALTDGSKATVFTGDDAAVGTNFVTFMAMVENALSKYVKQGGSVDIGNVILAAHSGGGYAMGRVATRVPQEMDAKISELWCLDSTYGSESAVLKWAQRPGHIHDRVWVYSSGASAGTDDHAKTAYDTAVAKKLGNVQVSVPFQKDGQRHVSRHTVNWHMGLGGPNHFDCIGAFLPRLIDSSAFAARD